MHLIKITGLNDQDVEELVARCPALIQSDNTVVLLESDWAEIYNSDLESDFTWVLVKI